MNLSDLSRRAFSRLLGAGLLFGVAAPRAMAQHEHDARRGRGGDAPLSTRVHLGEDGTITVMTGKVEMGQGARGQITQAAAEELGVPADRIQLVMGDTSLCPDDGGTWGSQTTPRTIPSVRWACAAAATILADYRRDQADDTLGYGDLARDPAAAEKLRASVPEEAELKPVSEWTVLGQDFRKPGRERIVRGEHRYPSDVIRPGMLYGKVLRPPAYGARLRSVDLSAAQEMEGVTVVRDGDFVGVAATRTSTAKAALLALAATATWSDPKHDVTNETLYDHLRRTARGVPDRKPFDERASTAARSLSATYDVPYAAHVPMEPRAAVAEFDDDGGLTIWVGNQNPFGVRGDVAREAGLPEERVRIVVPDFGGGFGGKSSSEWSLEAMKLARAANAPVSVRWSRAEEFNGAYHRPGTTMDCFASLDGGGNLQDWSFVNVNAGGSGIASPYRAAGESIDEAVDADEPLRQGSYRALGSTANNFGRECFVDELAHAAERDPLEWRLAHLESERLKDVLQTAADRFGWGEERGAGIGVGLACGTEKGSYVAACVEVEVNDESGNFSVRRVVQTYDCGAVMNPENCRLQVLGAILQALGPAVTGEAIRFSGGRVTNPRLSQYPVPRFADVPPEIDIHLIDRADVPSVGAGETPLIALAPAIANAVFNATGQRLRALPLKPQREAV